ncbi:2-hydroxy-6-oxo-6-(2'-aminophenyl)hexa-2,4-dienoic acid hydrolase [Spatholobus suberectus]|nr:2-hydroxy-6-oxo-6-(2'-aminophenyl)hexa-2,4-dienoic acid hydrolase [Spatholobus suberectus]
MCQDRILHLRYSESETQRRGTLEDTWLCLHKTRLLSDTVIIPNRHGEKLVGILHKSGTRDIVILCHGFRCSKDTNPILNLAVALENAKLAISVLTFLEMEVDDLHAVAQHFCESNRVISAIIGHSKGGDIVLLYASKYRDIKTVVNLSGCYDLKEGVEERLGKDYLERIKKDGFIDVKKRRSGLSKEAPEKGLYIHGSSDEIIPVEDAFEFAKIIPNHKLHVIEGADHRFSNHQGELSSIVVNFIKETLHQVKGNAS